VKSKFVLIINREKSTAKCFIEQMRENGFSSVRRKKKGVGAVGGGRNQKIKEKCKEKRTKVGSGNEMSLENVV
jgi:hypothetical protein